MVAVRALVIAVVVVLEGCSRSPPPPSPVASDESSAEQSPDLAARAEANTPFADLVRLAKSGTDQKVLLAYIDAAPVPYQLTTNELAFLADLGVSPEVLTKLGASLPETDQTEATPASVEISTAPATTTVETTAAPVTEEVTAPASPEDVSTTEEALVEPPVVVAPEEAAINISFFYEALSPYGSWMQVDGEPYWQPAAVVLDSGWRPYCQRGHWVNTDCGWAWYSDYSWGWAPFHYGRWRHDDRHGWIWAPDTVWAPAWVSWREHAGVIGWAPLPPEARYAPGAGFTYNGRAPAMGFEFGLQPGHYTFVRTEHFSGPGLARHILPATQVMQFYANTTIIPNNYAYNHNLIINRGPPVTQITAVTHREIPMLSIVDQDIRPGQPIRGNVVTADRFEVFRPRVAPTAPAAPPVVVARQQAEAARREEARRSSVFDTAQGGSLVRNESVRGEDSRAAIQPPSTRGNQPVVVRGQAEKAAERLREERRQAQAAQQQAAERLQQQEAAARGRAQQEAAAQQEAERLRAQREESTRLRAQQEAERLREQAAAAENLRQQNEAERLRQAEALARQQQQAAAEREREEQRQAKLAAERQREEQGQASEAAERLRAEQEAAARVRAQEAAERQRAQQEAAERQREEQQRAQQEAAQRQREEQSRAQQEAAARANAFQGGESGSAAQSASERGAASHHSGR
jgi:hypothetical protein